MYERWTDRARKVMALANEEAQRFNHEYIGTEHILLGCVKEEAGAKLLEGLGVDLRKMRREVEKLVKSGPDMVTMGKVPLTPRAKKIVEYSIEEARAYDYTEVDTEHVLLGILREQDGVAAQVLMNLGLRLEEVREVVLKAQGRPHDKRAPAERGRTAEEVDSPPLILLLDPGTATAEEIGQLLFEFSTLYRMLGGSGITFTTTDAREPAFA